MTIIWRLLVDVNVHRNRYAVAAHIFQQELGAFLCTQMIPQSLFFVGKLSGHTLFLDAAMDILFGVVGLDQIQVVADCLHAVEVIGVGGINDLAVAEMHLIAAVWNVVGKLKRNHIAEAIPIHDAGP